MRKTKHFYNGIKVCLSKKIIKKVLSKCQSLTSLEYELSKIENIKTVYGTDVVDMHNNEIFEFDIIYSIGKNKFYYLKFKNGKYLAYLLPFGIDNKGIDLSLLKKEDNILVLFNSYQIDNYNIEVRNMLYGVSNKKLNFFNMKKYVKELNAI